MVGNNDRNVHALLPDGTLSWQFETSNEVYQSPIVGRDGTIFTASEDGRFYAIAPDGAVRWIRDPPAGEAIPGVALLTADDLLIFGFSAGGSVLGVEASTGATRWEIRLGDPDEIGTAMAPAVGPDGSIYVYGNRQIHALAGQAPLETRAPWPKAGGDARNSGAAFRLSSRRPGSRVGLP